jgi:hypothetical protein
MKTGGGEESQHGLLACTNVEIVSKQIHVASCRYNASAFEAVFVNEFISVKPAGFVVGVTEGK